MSQAAKVVKALDDSRNRHMDYLNRFWLRQNARRLNVHVSKEIVFVNCWDVSSAWKNEKSIIVQDGKQLTRLGEFRLNKEALLLVERKSKRDYVVYLYVPT